MNEVEKTLTVEDVQKAMPNKKNLITDEVVALINKSQQDPEFQGESLLQTAVTYESVMTKNKVGIKDYLNAIRFVSYMITTDDNYTEAYKKVFWDRKFVQDRLHVSTGDTKYSELTSAASRYRRSKLVVDILTLSQAPLDLMFTGARYKALGVLSELMITSKLDRDKINAAKELLLATKGPENVKIDLDVGVKESSAVTNLQEQLAVLASKQKNFLENGVTDLKALGAMKPKSEDDVIDAEVTNG